MGTPRSNAAFAASSATAGPCLAMPGHEPQDPQQSAHAGFALAPVHLGTERPDVQADGGRARQERDRRGRRPGGPIVVVNAMEAAGGAHMLA